MYKLLILTLLFPFFAFSDEFILNLENVCSEQDQDLVTQKLKNASCGKFYSLSNTPTNTSVCRNSLQIHQDILIENGWTQKQLNLLGYYVTQERHTRDKKIKYTKYISEKLNISQAPTNEQDFLQLINFIRMDYNLNQIDNISTTTPGCENLFLPTN